MESRLTWEAVEAMVADRRRQADSMRSAKGAGPRPASRPREAAPAASAVTVRFASPEDARGLERLARLDSGSVPISRLSDGAPGADASSMFRDHIQELDMTAAEVRSHFGKLVAERALALETGVAEIAPYIADLEEEIAFCRELYVASAVTEIATLRAELFGPQTG
jgi:hypothetical protein